MIDFGIPNDYQKLKNPASRYAVVGVYVAKHKSGVIVGVTGAKSSVYNEKSLSDKLSKNFSSNSIDSTEISPSEMNSDIHASAEYRANMVKALAIKAVDAC